MKRPHQRGTSLIEALIAFLVLSLGVLGMARLQNHLHLTSDLARQRTEAVRLAQEDMEGLRGFAAVGASAELPSYDDVGTATTTVGAASGYRSNTAYRVERQITEADGAALKTATITVSWPDRTGATQSVLLQSVVAGTPPALSGALSALAGSPPHKTLHGRSARIPPQAKNLGDGRSVLKPANGTVAFVFSNTTGRITARCSDLDMNLGTQALTASDLARCTAADTLLLSGWVQFDTGTPGTAGDAPLAFTVALALEGRAASAAPVCATETQGRMVAYHCAIAPLNGRWSGRSSLVPQGWTIGPDADQYRVCRFSNDQDGSGAVDRNAEHPESYQQVDVPLMQQNFLVVRGDRPCPADRFTVAHQN